MVQENRAFDNYFGEFANYRVNIDHIPGAQMSDVNDLHTLPADYTIKNPQGQSFGPFHARTMCIENLSPSWDETHYDMDLVGNDWLNLTPQSQYKMDRFLDTTLSGGSGDQYDPTHTPAAGLLRSNRPAVLLRTGRAVCHQRHLVLAHSGEHRSKSHVFVRRHIVRTRLPAAESQRSCLAGGDILPRDDRGTRVPGVITTRTTACSWRIGLTGAIRRFREMFGNIQEYYSILSSPNADQNLPQVVFIERGSATGLDEHPDNNVQTGAARCAEHHHRAAEQRSMAGSGVHPDLRRRRRAVRSRWADPGYASRRSSAAGSGYGRSAGLFNVTGFRVPDDRDLALVEAARRVTHCPWTTRRS